MTHPKPRLAFLAAVALLLSSFLMPPTLADPVPKFIPFDFPKTNGSTQPRHINDRGQIIGFYGDLSQPQGFVLEGGVYIPLRAPGTEHETLDAITINNKGQIAGSAYDSTKMPHGFLVDQGKYKAIDYPKAKLTHVFGLNNQGDTVGIYGEESGQHGFLFKHGVYSTIHIPDADADLANAFGINDSGQIVGSFAIKNHEHGYLLSKGIVTVIDYPKANVTLPFGINNQGQVVGIYSSGQPNDYGRGFLWSHGVFTPIDYPGVPDGTHLFSINDKGQIVGTYADSQGHDHGFILLRVSQGELSLCSLSCHSEKTVNN